MVNAVFAHVVRKCGISHACYRCTYVQTRICIIFSTVIKISISVQFFVQCYARFSGYGLLVWNGVCKVVQFCPLSLGQDIDYA